MVMLLTDNVKIQEVLLFPAMKPIINDEEKKTEVQGEALKKEQKVSTGCPTLAEKKTE